MPNRPNAEFVPRSAVRAATSLVAVLALAGLAGSDLARAQAASDAATSPTGRPDPLAKPDTMAPSPTELLKDFNHFVLIRHDELAKANAQALLDLNLSPEEFVGLVEDSPDLLQRFERATRDALLVPGLEDLASRLVKLYEGGRLDRARSPEEIKRNLDLLTGNQRARLLASERIRGAGEYAAPQLIQVLLDRSNPALEAQVERLFVELGADAVQPLSAALLGVDVTTQSRLALLLGQIGHASALPYLYELARTTQDKTARASAARAITQIQSAPPNDGVSTAELYWDLGEKYYKGLRSLTMFPGEDHQLLWTYDPGVGLFPIAIRSEVFHEARAMEMAEKALRIDPEHEGALSLWLAANFSRELQQPEGYENPVYPPTRRTALYYAVMAGSGPTQRVLARALDNHSTALARKSIEALSLVAGDAGLSTGVTGRRPLLEALSYPDRRVQYDAALALGAAKPTTPFPGSERVVPLLAGAVRDAGTRYALVIAGDIDRQQRLRELVEEQGFKTLQAVSSFDLAASALAEAPGVDLVVTDLATDSTLRTIQALRAGPKTAASPVLALLTAEGLNQNFSRFDSDPLTGLARAGSTDEQLAIRIDELSTNASGAAVTEAEAERYAMGALDTLRDLAVNRNEVFRASDATLPLIAALADAEGEVKLKIADVLSRVDQSRAQVALMDAALKNESGERVILLGKVAESARAFGNRLEPRHVREISRLAISNSAEESTAAAALIGALNLQRTDLAPLILGEGEKKAAAGG